MDRIRRSLRESFRRKKRNNHENQPECCKPHQWQSDEDAVRSGECSFPVKYLGCREVKDSRGMQICEDALRDLRTSRRRGIKGILYVSGDGLRVVDRETKGLIVDQTIEKVSFCAPDRSHERGFSYICRDGTTRRWMCHGFTATKDSGERLSHAVGCAFSLCLERKTKRDKENNVSMTFDNKTSTFTRFGSFRQTSITERLTDPQIAKPAEPPPVKKVVNPFAIERPHATPQLLQRQGSFRAFSGLGQASPFKRQLSLRLNELPSNLERHRTLSLGPNPDNFPRPNGSATVAPIPEGIPVDQKSASDEKIISEMCQEISTGLQLLSSTHDDDPFHSTTSSSAAPSSSATFKESPIPASSSSLVLSAPVPPSQLSVNGIKWNITIPEYPAAPQPVPSSSSVSTRPTHHPPPPIRQAILTNGYKPLPPPPIPTKTYPPFQPLSSHSSTDVAPVNHQSSSDNINNHQVTSSSSPKINNSVSSVPPVVRRNMNQLRSLSEDRPGIVSKRSVAVVPDGNSSITSRMNGSNNQSSVGVAKAPLFNSYNRFIPKSTSFDTGTANLNRKIMTGGVTHDPFDTEWAEVAARITSPSTLPSSSCNMIRSSTNPFEMPLASHSTQGTTINNNNTNTGGSYQTSFEIQM